MFRGVEWGEYRLGDLFEIENTLSFNADSLVAGSDYDYVTRTSTNQGILRKSGFVNEENINPAGTWSLGLLQMDFFYRRKPWYAGQFVRKIVPKIDIPPCAALFFSAVLNKQKKKLLSVLVRNVDAVFKNSKVKLPVENGNINFHFMEKFIVELLAQYISELKAYLLVTGLENYTLTAEEEKVLHEFDSQEYREFDLIEIFDVRNTSNILSCEITPSSGKIPYLCASAENNSVSSYVSYSKGRLEKGHCIFIGGKTFVVSYQGEDFLSNDSHNLALYFKSPKITKWQYLYLATCVKKSLSHKYSWDNSISNTKIKADKITIPVKCGALDIETMELIVSAVKKLVIKDVVLFAEREMETMKIAVEQQTQLRED